MDYSKLSDQEINMAVAEILFPDRPVIESKSRPPCACITGHEPSKWVDYCNNPDDAWPIIVSHRIGLNFVNGAWRAQSMVRGYDECVHDNPLRAAMLVYLQLQEDK